MRVRDRARDHLRSDARAQNFARQPYARVLTPCCVWFVVVSDRNMAISSD
jgi:hypothetical protein